MSLRHGYLSNNIKSRSRRAGLHFPVGRIHRYLRKGPYSSRIGSVAPVYLAAVLEYLCAEIIELAGILANQMGKCKILPRHILLAVKNDIELDKLLAGAILEGGGVKPNIEAVLLSHDEE
eukprot:TRINITY_DN65633_c0_g1_i1.p1 TRINITY_DN65633_c0_g1~~TRINITY_DN65633_c0_g1_i1.p1  ORF type:complete len:120 (+),score=20.75 TRINITY_DN65633_c0_g1_i1:74-433(+)